MANTLDETKYDLDSAIPSGSWTLYFHSPEETKWTLNTFVSLGSMKIWKDFWTIINTLDQESFSNGMFFMMRDPVPPLWENHQNIRGGYYSFRCQKKDAPEIYIDYMISTMINQLTKHSSNLINGLSISPKRGFNIIKVWNTNAQVFNKIPDLHYGFNSVVENDVIYTPFVQKKM
jgi:hypothetical protein